MNKIFMIIGMLSIALVSEAQNIYTQDKNHTKVEFVATHFGISHVEGRFKSVVIMLKSKKDDFTDAEIEMTADVKSVDTDIEMRDNDLKSESWFDMAKYPTIVFKSTSFKKLSAKNYKLEGKITIHGVTKPISLEVVYNGKAINPMTKKGVVGFSISGKLNRLDFAVGTGGGNSVVSNEIELLSNVEFIVD